MENTMQDNSQLTGGDSYGPDAQPFEDLVEDPSRDFTCVDGEVFLCASRSRSSGSIAFPQREVCLETGERDMEPLKVGGEARLYSFSTVHVSSSKPVPYTLGYIDFPNGLRVLANVVTDEPQKLRCDQRVQLRASADDWYVVPV